MAKKVTSNILKPVVLIILDGWGISPSWGGNAIAMSNPPFINSLWRDYPHLILQAFRKIAGVSGKVSNSEIGHGSIGCGRLIYQDSSKINKAIKNGTFFKNPVLKRACQDTLKNKSSLHLVGMVSDGAIHSHIDHLFALLALAKKEGLDKVFVHVFLDGRDTPRTSGLIYLMKLENEMRTQKIGKISTLMGRYFAMDRDGHWDRTKRAYLALTKGKAIVEESPLHAISQAYKRGFTDETVPPIIIPLGKNHKIIKDQLIKNNDSVIFFNFRADRARQLSRAFVDKTFRPLWCFKKLHLNFVTLTMYQKGLTPFVAFPPEEIKNSLAEVLSKNKLRQLRVAESEKYAHVTYFFNGGREEAFPKEDRLIIASPRVDSFDKTPKMKAEEIADAVVSRLKKYDFIVINLANVDMVGHTGNIIAVTEAIKAIDAAVEKITNETLKQQGAVIITADHGNAEQMVHLEEEGDPETLHTLNPVPFLLITPFNKKQEQSALDKLNAKNILSDIMLSEYTLADIAPTILDLFHIKKPKEMTGQSLLDKLKT
jgi:2,3-bisphosphoglycerate-independent phosphoglycerate mutase